MNFQKLLFALAVLLLAFLLFRRGDIESPKGYSSHSIVL